MEKHCRTCAFWSGPEILGTRRCLAIAPWAKGDTLPTNSCSRHEFLKEDPPVAQPIAPAFISIDKVHKLDIEPYDSSSDTIKIEGTRYSGDFFREFGCNFHSMVGQVLRIDKKENGLVTVTRFPEMEEGA